MSGEMRTFGYLCPKCGKPVMKARSVFALEASGADIDPEGVSDTTYFEEYDIAVKQTVYLEADGTVPRITILYADYKQEGYYLSAQITYLPEQMDGDYPALRMELSSAYALTLPEIEPLTP